jgi:hypothetical protein
VRIVDKPLAGRNVKEDLGNYNTHLEVPMRGSGGLLPVLGLFSAGGAFGAGGALAAELDLTEIKAVPYTLTAPTWSVVGSVSPTFTNNALFSRDDRRPDVFYEPDVSARLDGNLSPDLSYRLYARAQYESFATEQDGNAAIARLGARLTENLDGWRITGIYENRYDYDGIFRDLAFISNDVSGSVSRDFTFGRLTLSPFTLLTYRFSDLAEARRWRLDGVLGIEVNLDSKWSVVSTPLIEAFWFTDGLNKGRQDQILSTSLGLKYNIRSNVSLTTSVVYEARLSNVAIRRYTDFQVGPTLDFAF